MNAAPTVHATAILVGEAGILIRGASGSGKSSLALALLDTGGSPAWLIADDRVALTPAHGRLVVEPPESLAGWIEIRGQGIAVRPFVAPAVIRLVVDLLPPGDCPRLPEGSDTDCNLAGITLPRLALPTTVEDGPARIDAALSSLRCSVEPRNGGNVPF